MPSSTPSRTQPRARLPLPGGLERRHPAAARAAETWAAAVGADCRARRRVAALVTNTYLLPRFRFVPRVSFHASIGSALCRRARSQRYAVGPPRARCARGAAAGRGRLLRRGRGCCAWSTRAGGSGLRYRAPSGAAFFAVATTFDAGWRALGATARRCAVYLTAGLASSGVELPAGEHRARSSTTTSRCSAGRRRASPCRRSRSAGPPSPRRPSAAALA